MPQHDYLLSAGKEQVQLGVRKTSRKTRVSTEVVASRVQKYRSIVAKYQKGTTRKDASPGELRALHRQESLGAADFHRRQAVPDADLTQDPVDMVLYRLLGQA